MEVENLPLEAIAIELEAIAVRLEAIAIRFFLLLGWRPLVFLSGPFSTSPCQFNEDMALNGPWAVVAMVDVFPGKTSKVRQHRGVDHLTGVVEVFCFFASNS